MLSEKQNEQWSISEAEKQLTSEKELLENESLIISAINKENEQLLKEITKLEAPIDVERLLYESFNVAVLNDQNRLQTIVNNAVKKVNQETKNRIAESLFANRQRLMHKIEEQNKRLLKRSLTLLKYSWSINTDLKLFDKWFNMLIVPGNDAYEILQAIIDDLVNVEERIKEVAIEKLLAYQTYLQEKKLNFNYLGSPLSTLLALSNAKNIHELSKIQYIQLQGKNYGNCLCELACWLLLHRKYSNLIGEYHKNDLQMRYASQLETINNLIDHLSIQPDVLYVQQLIRLAKTYPDFAPQLEGKIDDALAFFKQEKCSPSNNNEAGSSNRFIMYCLSKLDFYNQVQELKYWLFNGSKIPGDRYSDRIDSLLNNLEIKNEHERLQLRELGAQYPNNAQLQTKIEELDVQEEEKRVTFHT